MVSDCSLSCLFMVSGSEILHMTANSSHAQRQEDGVDGIASYTSPVAAILANIRLVGGRPGALCAWPSENIRCW